MLFAVLSFVCIYFAQEKTRSSCGSWAEVNRQNHVRSKDKNQRCLVERTINQAYLSMLLEILGN
jgi:hypothetical protein